MLWPGAPEPRFEHVEVAVKFYLASRAGVESWDDFIAPNPADILGKKLRWMLDHQLLMGQTGHIRRRLAELADCDDVNVRSSLWMNGRLFCHAAAPLDAPGCAQPESWHERLPMLSADLEVGWWCRFGELPAVLSERLSYVILQKPYWLCPLSGKGGGRDADHGGLLSRGELLGLAAGWRRFQYIR
ncbi:unnamed protein product, partial [Prorocentrum cordatum]